MADLFEHSIHVILANQAAGGAYVASPNFSVYRYCWFRDGAFIAYAMDLVGEHESARRFHEWAASTILRHADKAQRAIEKAQRGEPLGDDYLHTRYTVGGEEAGDEWPNFQLDGFGTWLWALAEHLRLRGGRPSPHWRQAIHLAGSYLASLWRFPCYDLWEEHQDKVHPYTLAAIYAGLKAATTLTGEGWPADEVRRFVLEHGVRDGHLVKYLGSEVVDASLLGVATPYRLLAPDDPIMQATVARIEADLRHQAGGVHRYAEDTYYGGGEWVLLTAWLGWHYAEVGEFERARELLNWVEAQADGKGDLPEQVPHSLNDPAQYQLWRDKWGDIAKPLLWSHAKYLILRGALK
ncbi:MAG: glycoside hydrolase family 15 protein [Anaerolineae bacterium]